VTVEPPAGPRDLAARVAAADCVVLPSLYDAWPWPGAEALARGVPVIVTTASGLADLVRSGESGDVVPPGCATALRDALARAGESRDALARLGRGAREAARRHGPESARTRAAAALAGCPALEPCPP
jgi:glycogen(starch) synthase